MNIEAVVKAAETFQDRKNSRYQRCAPVIARLAEALARRGRFKTDDKILDVAIALERIYQLEGGEISYKLKTRAAYFLGSEKKDRLRVFRDVEEFYKIRSAIVHQRSKPPSDEERNQAFNKGFDLARRSIVKLLRDGAPKNWNEMVIVGSQSTKTEQTPEIGTGPEN